MTSATWCSPSTTRTTRTIPKTGLLRIDRTAINADAKLDGQFLLHTSDVTLTAEDVALGYKLQVERGWRDGKLHLDLQPVYHRREDRIRSHVLGGCTTGAESRRHGRGIVLTASLWCFDAVV